MINWEQKLDRLYPKFGSNKRCAVCGRPAEHVHHIIPRANILLRWDINNLIPLCFGCHRMIHDRKQKLVLSPTRREYLERMKNVEFKDYLLANSLTREDFFEEKYNQLKEAIK